MNAFCPSRLAVLLTAFFALATTPAAAQDAISTDRPGFGSATSTLAPGRVQLEAGTPSVAYDREDAGFRNEQGEPIDGEFANRLINFPTLVRVGVSRGVELRFSSAIYNFLDQNVSGDATGTSPLDRSSEGIGGLDVGAKLEVLEARGALTGFVVVPTVTLPIGSEAFTPDRAAFSVEADASFTLSPDWTLGTVATLFLDPNEGQGDYDASGLLVASLSRSLTDRLGGYVEGGYQPEEEGRGPVYLGGGLTYLVSPTAQLDVSADRQVNSALGADWLFSGGVSIRFGS